MRRRDDTIAAIATGRGSAALGIVRICGPAARAVLAAVVPGTAALHKPRRMCFGRACHPHTHAPLDDVLCFFAKGPLTATGEDIAELHGHGGPVVLDALLNATLAAGAVLAEPGEFTYRAFVHGRIDLTQAEAVMHLIGARSDRARRAALGTLEGGLGRVLTFALERLTAIAAEVEAGLDFPDEDLPLARAAELALTLEQTTPILRKLADSFRLGDRLIDGARVAIVGPPNAGKSSLLNRLVAKDHALVDVEPGTTRDVLEARGEAVGIPLVFLDTAGLRTNADRLEQLGIDRALAAARAADLLLVVVDGTAPPATLDEVLGRLALGNDRSLVLVANKRDLPGFTLPRPASLRDVPVIAVSALSGDGLDELVACIGELLGADEAADETLLLTARQHEAVTAALAATMQAHALLSQGRDPELVAIDLGTAREQLAALLGRNPSADVLDAIFSSFCLGK